MNSPRAIFWFTVINLLVCAALAAMVMVWTWALGRFWIRQPLLPDAKPRPVPWGTRSVVAVVLVWVVVNVVVSTVYLAWTGARRGHRPPTLTEQMIAVSLINGVLLCVIPAILRLTSGSTLKDLGLERRGLARNALIGAGGFAFVAPIAYFVSWLSVKIWDQNKHPLEQMVTAEPTAGIAVLALLSAVILAPAAEELFFRGILQSWLNQLFRRALRGVPGNESAVSRPASDKAVAVVFPSTPDLITTTGTVTPVAVEDELFSGHWSAPVAPEFPPETEAATEEDLGGAEPFPPDHEADERLRPRQDDRAARAAIFFTSALFAAVHLPQWPAPIAIFFLSVGLGVVYQRTGSLFASMVMHALFNGFSTLILFQSVLLGHPANPKVAPTATYSPVTTVVRGVPPSALREVFARDR